jgi:hypothetical protein
MISLLIKFYNGWEIFKVLVGEIEIGRWSDKEIRCKESEDYLIKRSLELDGYLINNLS